MHFLISLHELYWRKADHKMAVGACHLFRWIALEMSHLELLFSPFMMHLNCSRKSQLGAREAAFFWLTVFL